MISYIFLFDTVRVPVFYLSKNRTENRFLVPVRVVNRVPVHKTITKYLNYYIWRVRIVRKVILIRQHLPNMSCCVSCSRSWRNLPILERIPIGKLSKTRKLSIRTNGEFAQNTLSSLKLSNIECISKLFGRVCHCFSHSTVASSKTRQITIRGLGLNTTNHDMRPIGLMKRRLTAPNDITHQFSFHAELACVT